ncbi:MAG: hypothetical protein ABI597_03005 [Gammaproteobacteria bacterium]
MIKHTIQLICKNAAQLFLLFCMAIFSCTAFANNVGLGQVANNLMEPVTILSGFLSGAAIILGLSLLFASFARYMQYRVNPLAHPIGSVITLFLIGILLLALPLIYKLTESGIPFSLG